MNRWLSASDLAELAKFADLKSLPRTDKGISVKAKRDEWQFEKVDGKGGPGGKKTIFKLPNYVIDELEQKGLLHLIGGTETDTPLEGRNNQPDVAHIENIDYADWAARQDTRDIVPVHYYKEVFASAGSGAIPWDTKPEAMWFRDSFFKYLGARPADCFCTRIDGDSMFPTLIDQGTALWYSTNQYTREGIYLFRQYDELRAKRMQRISTHIYRLISDNPNKSIYPTVDIDTSAHTQQDFEILGRYLWHCGIAK